MPARESNAPGRMRHVGRGLGETGGIDDLALDPDGVGLAGDRLDREPEQSVAVVGVFEACVRRDRRYLSQLGQKLIGLEVRPPIRELSGVATVADQPGAVREQLRDRGLRDLLMQLLDVVADCIVELQSLQLPQPHDAGRQKGLAVRGDAEAVPRRELFAAVEIGMAERMFGNDLAAMGDGDDAADLLRSVELKAEPVRHVIDCGSKPWVHVIDPSKSAGAIWMDEKWALLLSDKKENGATRRGCAALEERALGRRDLVDETGAR